MNDYGSSFGNAIRGDRTMRPRLFRWLHPHTATVVTIASPQFPVGVGRIIAGISQNLQRRTIQDPNSGTKTNLSQRCLVRSRRRMIIAHDGVVLLTALSNYHSSLLASMQCLRLMAFEFTKVQYRRNEELLLNDGMWPERHKHDGWWVCSEKEE